MKNIVVMVSIGRDDLLEYSLPSVELFCKKYNLELDIIKESVYKLPDSSDYNYLNFEKNQVIKYFDNYDRLLRLDSDVIITPNAPNFFSLPPNQIYATFEDVGSRKRDRMSEIRKIKQSLGHIDSWKEGYFNSGVLLVSKDHKEIFNITDLDITKDLGKFKEQNVLNWKVRKAGFSIKNMDKNFNHMRIFEEPWSNSNRLEANIIHYAGSQHDKVHKMKIDYECLYKKR